MLNRLARLSMLSFVSRVAWRAKTVGGVVHVMLNLLPFANKSCQPLLLAIEFVELQRL